MPRVELRDAFGTSYQIVTTDREMLGQWFREWLPRLFGDLPADVPAIVRLWPLETAPGVYDWLTDSRHLQQWITIPRDPGIVLDALDKWRKEHDDDSA